MDFSFSEEQTDIAALAKRILDDKVTEELLREVEAGAERFDRGVWDALAKANLLGIALPEDVGGNGYGIIEQCLVLEQVGRTVAPVPIVASIVLGARTIAEFGTAEQRKAWVVPAVDGTKILTAALAEPLNRDPASPTTTAVREPSGGWRLDGVKTRVDNGTLADLVLVPAAIEGGRVGVFLVEPSAPGVTVERQKVTNRESDALVTLDGCVVGDDALLGGRDDAAGVVRAIVEFGTVALCAQQLGIVSKALEMTAEYTKTRVQFDRPIATFQAVGARAADAYIDVEAVRLTLWQAAWRLSAGLPAATEVEVAKFWAAEAGHRVGHAAVHLHGGMGVDVDYPLHRYFIAAKEIEFALGGATDQLLRIGAAMAASTPE